MAKSKDDITYGTSQARLTEDEAVRVVYKHGTPLEGGKIADSEPVDMFSSAHNISKSSQAKDSNTDQSQLHLDTENKNERDGSIEFTTGAPRLPNKVPPTMAHKKY
ncbi:hypothetical protein Lal_00029401 [Lupinus albus]|uniref:Uncharacterized protein n=1 Tax=Lupinus albus TaxID=3870 RepID=A0A6A5NQJ3_LUPAL|nr:hypothetical protein Lalb_Chr19g0133391 [Lupinus albus]KAF1885512.1 hypothetical protein Lal_00029401 [Lupinus albus]